MKCCKWASVAVALLVGACGRGGGELHFDAQGGERGELQLWDGSTVSYTAYERLYYVERVEDSLYQYMNVYVPDGATQQTPILMRTYIGGYMAAEASRPQAGDATGRALKEGYVVAIPGSRGRNATVVADEAYAKAHKGVSVGQTVYTGRAPAGLLDLKAAVRYLRRFDKKMLGDAERIVIDGTSAGGAMAALVGATGNHPDYEPLLKQMGAAKEHDDVYATVCFCPITDLEHADMAYEWLYWRCRGRQDDTHAALTAELAAQFPAYLDSLHLTLANGLAVTADNYLDLLKRELVRSAQRAKDAGADIADSIGLTFSEAAHGRMVAPPDGREHKGARLPKVAEPKREQGEYIVGVDMGRYLDYVVATTPLKVVPAFDSWIEGVNTASGENEVFGDGRGTAVNFTDFTAGKNGQTLSGEVLHNVRLMNPMHYIRDPKATTAKYWYIRHGARDRDTSFPIPFNLALMLAQAGCEVDFLLAWNRPHSGDYSLDELFGWLNSVVKH